MNESQDLISLIVEGIQNKKGHKVTIADMSGIDGTICNYFVICQGNTPTQVDAIADSVWELLLEKRNLKPFAIDGVRNAQWIVMDYGEVMLHIFIPEARSFYNLENLWADATLTEIADID